MTGAEDSNAFTGNVADVIREIAPEGGTFVTVISADFNIAA